jgi:hypothetical protein
MEACLTVDEVLDRIVRAITNERFGVYNEPRLALRLKHVASMKVRNKKYVCRCWERKVVHHTHAFLDECNIRP